PDCTGKTTCTPIKDPVIGDIDTITVTEKFYVRVVEGAAKVPVAVLVKREVEEVKFCKLTLDFHCCSITVCVPKETCVTTEKKCELRRKEVKLEARVRRTGGVDVVAIGVNGMPQQWVLKLGITKAEVKRLYGIEVP